MLVLDPKPNLALLDAVEQKILADPKSWKQAHWHSGMLDENMCSTSFCFAGHAATMAGATAPKYWYDAWMIDPATGTSSNWTTDEGFISVAEFARQKLGLTVQERKDLFFGLNSLGDVQMVLFDIRARAHAIEIYEAVVLGDYEPIPFHGHDAVLISH